VGDLTGGDLTRGEDRRGEFVAGEFAAGELIGGEDRRGEFIREFATREHSKDNTLRLACQIRHTSYLSPFPQLHIRSI